MNDGHTSAPWRTTISGISFCRVSMPICDRTCYIISVATEVMRTEERVDKRHTGVSRS